MFLLVKPEISVINLVMLTQWLVDSLRAIRGRRGNRTSLHYIYLYLSFSLYANGEGQPVKSKAYKCRF